MANMKIQPGNYKVMLWGAGDKGAAKFESSQVSYVIAMEADSTHDF